MKGEYSSKSKKTGIPPNMRHEIKLEPNLAFSICHKKKLVCDIKKLAPNLAKSCGSGLRKKLEQIPGFSTCLKKTGRSHKQKLEPNLAKPQFFCDFLL